MLSTLNLMYAKRPSYCISKNRIPTKKRKVSLSAMRMQSEHSVLSIACNDFDKRSLSKTCRGGDNCCTRDHPCGEVGYCELTFFLHPLNVTMQISFSIWLWPQMFRVKVTVTGMTSALMAWYAPQRGKNAPELLLDKASQTWLSGG